MPRFFIRSDQVQGDRVRIEGDDARHLAGPLRVREGEHLVVVDDRGVERGVRVRSAGARLVEASVEWSRPATGEPRLRLHVLHALIREFDDVVEGLAQTGAGVIHPVLTSRTVSRPDPSRAEARLRRWRTIAREAAQLAHRGAPPQVEPPLPLDRALAALPPRSRIIACVMDADIPLHRVTLDALQPLALVIGPEGGLDPEEVERLRAAGAEAAHLGGRVLPARLAGSIAAALSLAAAGDLDAPPVQPPT